MNSSGDITRWVVPSRQGVLSFSTTWPAALACTRSCIAVDTLGNVWCGFGSDGSLAAKPEELDGVRVYDSAGRALAHIHLPERCANLCFGGPKRNRLFMAASHSLYALYVNTRGAVA